MNIGVWLILVLVGILILVPFGVLATVVWSRQGSSSVAMLVAGLALVGLGIVLIAREDAAHAKQNE